MKTWRAGAAVAFAMALTALWIPCRAEDSGLNAANMIALLNGTPLPFYVYHGYRAKENHYIPSGWMGDYRDLSFTDHYPNKTGSPRDVIRIVYKATGSQGAGWAGIYWQHPANNWGGREGGFNLNGAQHLKFLARGEQGGEVVAEVKIGGIQGNFSDSGSAAIGQVSLTKSWKEYAIDLGNQDLSNISGGFCITFALQDNPNGAVVYLDNIRFE